MYVYLSALVGALLVLFSSNVKAKPQDANIFENMAKTGLEAMGNMAEMVSNGALLSKQMGFASPFGQASSDTQIGAGGAMRNNNDDDDSSEEIRRKRSLDLDTNAPCHTGQGGYGTGGGGTGAGAGGGGTGVGAGGGGTGAGAGAGTGTGTGAGAGIDGSGIDVEEARRRAQRRAAAQRAKNARKTSGRRRNKYFTSTDDEDVQQALTRRRKRQTELDDLNANMTNAGSDFTQAAQQFGEKIRNVFESFMNSMNDMAQKLKQHFTGGSNSTTTDDI